MTEAVRRKPYSVLLWGEVEKAHPDVFNLLLQVLEDGRLTDSHGRTVDFKNTVIVMTSNLGSEHIQANELNTEEIKQAVMEQLRNYFRPEFLNRIDETVVFHSLARQHIADIAAIQLESLQRRLADKELQLSISDQVLASLVDEGYDPVYGARPLKRVLQQQLENPLAQKLLAGDFVAGDTIVVDYKHGTGGQASSKMTFIRQKLH